MYLHLVSVLHAVTLLYLTAPWVTMCSFVYSYLSSNLQPVERKRPDRSVYTVDSLQEALETFTGEEILSAKNRWLCPRCETHVKAVKRVTIWKLPPLLIVHFKRFSYSKCV